jgi:CDP-glycerol glycerophosphotransferase (TagB/SpsB family)
MWKYDGLFQLMLADERYNPIIVSSLGYSADKKTRLFEQQKMKDYFSKKGFPFLEGYNAKKQEWYDIKKHKPDLIFYTQPYNKNPYKGYNIENFYKYSLFAYVPYAFWVEKGAWGYDCLFHNIAWRLFYSTNIHLQHAINYSYVRGCNVNVVGYPMADRFLRNSDKPIYPWKINNPKLKRVIWAPHHSITKGLLEYSTFLDIAEDMLQLANKYSGRVQFAFKPHPTLKNKLYKLKEWGVEKTDYYYKCWENTPNAILADSDYVDLFLTSDAMIHDCSSFSAEYLYTKHPVMFITKSNHLDYLCDFGKKCFEVHYRGYNINDIDYFLNDVVINGNDVMMDLRNTFFDNYLSRKDGAVSDVIFHEINKLLDKDEY